MTATICPAEPKVRMQTCADTKLTEDVLKKNRNLTRENGPFYLFCYLYTGYYYYTKRKSHPATGQSIREKAFLIFSS